MTGGRITLAGRDCSHWTLEGGREWANAWVGYPIPPTNAISARSIRCTSYPSAMSAQRAGHPFEVMEGSTGRGR